MPALAGASRMPYRRFLAWNAVGGTVWGVAFVLLGYLAGSSYRSVARQAGYGTAIAITLVVLVTLVAWRVRVHRRESAGTTA